MSRPSVFGQLTAPQPSSVTLNEVEGVCHHAFHVGFSAELRRILVCTVIKATCR